MADRGTHDLGGSAIARSIHGRPVLAARAPAASRASATLIAATAAAGSYRILEPRATVPGGRHAATGWRSAERNRAGACDRRGRRSRRLPRVPLGEATSSARRSMLSTRSARCLRRSRAFAEDAEVPRRRRQPARRRAAGGGPAARASTWPAADEPASAAGSSWCEPTAIARGLIVDGVADVLRVPADSREQPPDLTAADRASSCAVSSIARTRSASCWCSILSELLTPAEQERLRRLPEGRAERGA